jgi:phage tail-like protein
MATVARSERLRRRKQKVPQLVGLEERDARLVLRHRGFFDPDYLGTPKEGEPNVDVRFIKSYAPYNTVVQQSPLPGQIVDSDSVIRMTVSMESLLDYLPAVYRRRDVGRENFIQEFLWIFQHVFRSIEMKIEDIHRYFGVFSTPAEFLPWLASWVAFTLDGEWSEAEKRLNLKKAVEFYQIRGTVRGITEMVKLYTGVDVHIVENDWPLNGFQIGVHSTIGKDSAILPPTNRAHCFIVEVALDEENVDDDLLIKLHQIISIEKPAHTTYYLRFTGEPKVERRWSGPVIGAYRIGSTPIGGGGEEAGEGDDSESGAEAKASAEEEEPKRTTRRRRSRRSRRKKEE